MSEIRINPNPYIYTTKISEIKNNKNKNFQATITEQISFDKFTYNDKSELRKEFEEIKEQQGIIGKAWDGIKNIFGAKSGSKHIDTIIKQAELGKISKEEAQEALNKYKEGQKTCVDVVADLASGILAVGAFALAVPTGGASLAVGLGLATAVGAGVKVGIKAGDAIATGKEYAGKDLLYDTLTGGINGVLAPITNGLGNTVTKTIGKKLGLKIIQEGAEEVAEQGIKLGIKQTAKNIVLNQTIDVAEGTIGKRALALGAGMAIDGALGGASDNMLRAGLNGENVIKAGIQGAIGGAIMAPVIGGGFRVAGQAGKALNNKITTKIVLPDGINTKFKQGQTGDCALLSTIDGIMNNPNTAKTFKKSITKTISGDYNVKIGDNIVKVAKSSLSDEMLSDKTGIRIFEQAYKQLTGDIDGGFAEVVAKQFGLNPVHIANESITDELLDTLASNKSNTVLSLGTLIDTDGAISPTGTQRHYFTIKDIDSTKKTVKLTSPIDTSKTIELSYDDIKALGISIDGGSLENINLPNSIRDSNDVFFRGIDTATIKDEIITKTNLSETDISNILNKLKKDISLDNISATLEFYGISADEFASVFKSKLKESGNNEEAFIAVLNTLQNISKIRNNPTFEPFNLSFRETQELHDAINAFDLDTIQTILYLNNESVFEQIQDNIDSRIYESNLLNTIRTIQQDIVGFQYYNPSDIAEITINGKTKKIFFPNADQITPIQLPDNIADDLIKSNLLTMDIINKLEQFNIELPSTGHSNLAISSGKNKSVLKIKYSIQDLIAKAKSQGIDSLSSHEIHVLTDCFDTLYRSTKDPQFIKLVNSIINDKNNNQHLRLIYAYIKKMKELAQPILKRNKVQIEDHAYMRMLDRNLISVADHNNNRMLSFEEFIKLLSSKVKDTKEKELYIQGFHNGNIIKLLLKSGDNGTTIIDSIMLQ